MNIRESTSKEFFDKVLNLGPDWEVTEVVLDEEHSKVGVELDLRKGAKKRCPECGAQCPQYDRGRTREWRHLDTMELRSFLRARVPRVQCPEHGVLSMKIPWAEAHARHTLGFEIHAIDVLENARSTTQAEKLLRIGWGACNRIMTRSVERGLERRKLESIEEVGMDEKSFRKGHRYITTLNDLKEGRVLEVVEGRTEEAAMELWEKIPKKTRSSLKAVAMDMWQAFENAARRMVPNAVIVHDKFHVSQHLNKGINKVRAEEHRKLMADGDDILKGTRWLWLLGEENLSDSQYESFEPIKDMALKTSKAWMIKESFRLFWDIPRTAEEAKQYFDDWYRHTIYSKIEPMKSVARMLKERLANVLTWWKHRITNAVSEGLNSKIQTVKAAARGFHSFASYRIRILFFCGKLDMKPCLTHSN